MDTNEVREKVQDLIIEGKLENAAEEIIEFLDSGVMNKKDKTLFQLYNQSIHQISQLNELKNAKLSGIIDPDDADRKRNQIRMALLDINARIADLKTTGSDESVTPILQPKNTGDGGSKKNTFLYAIIGALSLGLIGMGVMFFMKNDKPAVAENKGKIVTEERVPAKPNNGKTTTTNNIAADRTAEDAKRRREQEEAKRRADEEAERNKKPESPASTIKLNDISKNKKFNPNIKLDPKITKIRPELIEAILDDYTKLTFSKIKSYASKMQMASIDGYSKLKKGSILVYKTGAGRYGKLEILEIGQDLKIRATTYSSAGSVRKSTPGVVIKGTYACDLDLMMMTRSGIDFQWEIQSSSKRYLRPRDQAIFYQIK